MGKNGKERERLCALSETKEKKGGRRREFLMETGTPPQEEDAPVESGEPRLGLQRKRLTRWGRREVGGIGVGWDVGSEFEKHRDISQQIPLHFLSPLSVR